MVRKESMIYKYCEWWMLFLSTLHKAIVLSKMKLRVEKKLSQKHAELKLTNISMFQFSICYLWLDFITSGEGATISANSRTQFNAQ